MKIAQVNLGLLPIPPNGWGAVEKIIWNYKLSLEQHGHEVFIPYINEIEKNQYDVVHVHAWNHALELHDRGIPYVFTLHDHHTVLYGKDSVLYKDNLRAMELAELAIVPAKFLVQYFNNIPIYLPHGIDLLEYTVKSGSSNDPIKLLCVGNNGLAGDKLFDRKGFQVAIEAARKLNLPITIVGPTHNNKDFFNANPNLVDGVNVLYDLNDEQLRDVYASHDILIHASSIEAGHPPLTLLEAAAMGLPIISTDCNGDLFSTIAERNSDDIVSKIKSVIKMLQLNRAKTIRSVDNFDWHVITGMLETLYKERNLNNMKKSAMRVYSNAVKQHKENIISINFVDGATVEITGTDNRKYTIQFIDSDTNEIVYQTDITTNHWAKCSRKWFTNWKIHIESEGTKPVDITYNCANTRVLISFESSSLGDTIAWFPYVEEFRKKHNCKVIVSTFMNDLFKSEYPDLEFIEPGTTVENIYALYRLGCFYDDNGYDKMKHKTDYRKLRLQEMASDILGLEFKEIKPKLHVKNRKKVLDGDYATIGIHSTAQLKYWNNGTGWQDLVDYLNSKNIKTVHISKQVGEYMGNKPPINVIDKTGDYDIHNRITDMINSKMFIGISSGLSWVAWALGIPTVIISGCTEKVHEPTSGIHRIINESVCNSCFSDNYFNKGDWNWCPKLKTTPRQFECSKSITFNDFVKPKINEILKLI